MHVLCMDMDKTFKGFISLSKYHVMISLESFQIGQAVASDSSVLLRSTFAVS